MSNLVFNREESGSKGSGVSRHLSRGSALVGIVFCALLGFSSQSLAWYYERGDFSEWLSGVKLPKVSWAPFQGFFLSLASSDPAEHQVTQRQMVEFQQRLFEHHKEGIRKGLQNILKTQTGGCESKSKILIEPFSGTQKEFEKKFESQLLRMEMMDCLPSEDLDRVVSTFLEDSFQLKSVSGLTAIDSDSETNTVCYKTDVFVVGKSSFCVRFALWRDETTRVLMSFLETSQEGASAPVYLRLVSTVFKKLKSGGIGMFNLTYGRGPDLPLHFIVKGTVQRHHQDFVESLNQSSLGQ